MISMHHAAPLLTYQQTLVFDTLSLYFCAISIEMDIVFSSSTVIVDLTGWSKNDTELFR